MSDAMRASFFLLAAPLAIAACGGDDKPAGPRDLGPLVDLGTDAGSAPDLSVDAPMPVDLGFDFGPPMVCTFDAGQDLGPPPCRIDGGAPDLGPLPDLGPFELPDLGYADAADDAQPRPVPPTVPDMGPGYVRGCPTLTYCLAPPSSGLTWDNFAREFFATYCTRCHSVTRSGAARGTPLAGGNAPDCRNWDDRASVDAYLPLIRRYVGESMYMPYDEYWTVPCERRRELVTWIDEGAP